MPRQSPDSGVTFPTLAVAYDADGEELEEHTILPATARLNCEVR